MTDLEIVRAACIRANPVTLPVGAECPYCQGPVCYCPERMRNGSWKSAGRPLRLTDVLLALNKVHRPKVLMDVDGMFYEVFFDANRQVQIGKCLGGWDLFNDDVSQQSPETLKFLADLLRV